MPDPQKAASYIPAYGMIVLTLTLLLRPTGLLGRKYASATHGTKLMGKQHVPTVFGALFLLFFAAFPFLYSAGDYDYVMHVIIIAFFYAILASSWSMLAGYAGQFSFGHMGFMGIGSYTTALLLHYVHFAPEPTTLCTEFNIGGSWMIFVNPVGVTSTSLDQSCLTQALEIWNGSVPVSDVPVWIGIILGTIMGGIAGLLIGLLVLRLRAAYLALFTLGFARNSESDDICGNRVHPWAGRAGNPRSF